MDFLKRWLKVLSRYTPSVPIIVWRKSTQLIRADFEARYALDKGSVFNAEYIKALTSRRQEKQSLLNKLIAFNLTTTAFMAAWLFVDGVQFPFLGLMVDGRLIELVRVIVGLVAIQAGVIFLEIRQSGAVIDVICGAHGSIFSAYYKMSLVGPGESLVNMVPLEVQDLLPTAALRWALGTWARLVWVGIGLFVLACWAANLAVTWSMFFCPALGPTLSRLLGGFTLLCDVVAIGLIWLAYMPLPLSPKRR